MDQCRAVDGGLFAHSCPQIDVRPIAQTCAVHHQDIDIQTDISETFDLLLDERPLGRALFSGIDISDRKDFHGEELVVRQAENFGQLQVLAGTPSSTEWLQQHWPGTSTDE